MLLRRATGTHLIARMYVRLLALPSRFQAQEIVDDSLDLPERFFDLASEKETRHADLSDRILLQAVDYVEPMQKQRGRRDGQEGA